jgi:hypothetical protein
MGFIPRNEGFICAACGQNVPAAQGTCRNHCPECLTSKHVDDEIPGDRAATCGGLMPTIQVEGTDPNNLDLVQQCQRCHKTGRCRTAPDDSQSTIIAILKKR